LIAPQTWEDSRAAAGGCRYSAFMLPRRLGTGARVWKGNSPTELCSDCVEVHDARRYGARVWVPFPAWVERQDFRESMKCFAPKDPAERWGAKCHQPHTSSLSNLCGRPEETRRPFPSLCPASEADAVLIGLEAEDCRRIQRATPRGRPIAQEYMMPLTALKQATGEASWTSSWSEFWRLPAASCLRDSKGSCYYDVCQRQRLRQI
jgi:hypothetical protein